MGHQSFFVEHIKKKTEHFNGKDNVRYIFSFPNYYFFQKQTEPDTSKAVDAGEMSRDHLQ